MSSRVVTQFDIDFAQLKLKSEQIKLEMKQISAEAARMRLGERMAGGGGGRMNTKFAFGNMGQQFQDIAVQAQSGTKAVTILTQQGSQMASIFGPGGALVGAGLAIGGALWSSAQKGEEAFNALIEGGAKFEKEMKAIISGGGLSDMISGFGKTSDRMAEIRKQTEETGGAWGVILSYISSIGQQDAWVNGPDTKRMTALRDEAGKALELQRQLQAKIIEASGEEVKLAEMKASGNEEGARAMERQLALQRELRRISALDLPDAAKKTLSDNATRISEVKGRAEDDKRKADAAAKLQRAQENFERTTIQNALAPQGRLVQLEAQRRELIQRIQDARGDEVKQLEYQTQLSNTNLAIDREKLSIAEKQAKMKLSREDQQAGMAVMEARAAGKNKLADKLEKENKMVTRARSLATDLGISAEDALGMARREQDAQDRADKRKARPGHIFAKPTQSRGFLGLHSPEWNKGMREFKEMQQIPFFDRINKRETSRGTVNVRTNQMTRDTELLARINAGIEKLAN